MNKIVTIFLLLLVCYSCNKQKQEHSNSVQLKEIDTTPTVLSKKVDTTNIAIKRIFLKKFTNNYLLTNSEKNTIMFDSAKYWSLYIDTVKRRHQMLVNFPKNRSLTTKERLRVLVDSAKYWAKYVDSAKVRYRRDSIRFAKTYNTIYDKKRKTIYPVEFELPFGSDVLIKHNFPNGEFSFQYSENDTIVDRHQQEFYEVIKFYNEMEATYPDAEAEDWSMIEINNVKYLEFEKGEFDKIRESNDQFIYFAGFGKGFNEFNHRLGNIGNYEVYYSIQEKEYGKCWDEMQEISAINCCYDFRFCIKYGFLILYERATKNATIINTFYTRKLPEQGVAEFRFFYVTENGKIKIFNGNSSSRGHSNNLREDLEIDISNDGKINVSVKKQEK